MTNSKQEIWKDISGYEGKYEVSNFGRVRNKKTEQIMKQYINENGYCIVGLYSRVEQATKHFRVHRLVADAFIPNTDNKRTVNHKDGCKANNFVNNLEWATHKENLIHARNIGLIVHTEKQREVARESMKKNRLLSNNNRKRIFCIDCEGNIKEYNSVREASHDVGVGSSSIVNCLKGKTHTSAGMKWRYCDGD